MSENRNQLYIDKDDFLYQSEIKDKEIHFWVLIFLFVVYSTTSHICPFLYIPRGL